MPMARSQAGIVTEERRIPFSGHRTPIESWLRRARPAGRLKIPHPHVQMGVLCRPGQHRKGDPEIVVLPHRALVDGTGVAIFNFQICELLVAAPDIRALGQAHKVGDKFTMEQLEQDSSSDRVSGP